VSGLFWNVIDSGFGKLGGVMKTKAVG